MNILDLNALKVKKRYLFSAEEDYSAFICTYTAPSRYQNGGWVNIAKTGYLVKAGSDEKIVFVPSHKCPFNAR